MALQARIRTAKEWETFFTNAEIPEDESNEYAELFVENRITEATITDLHKETLRELGTTVLGNELAIIQDAKRTSTTPATVTNTPRASKTPTASISAKLPSLQAEMTHPQFQKFKVDWSVYKQITALPPSQIPPYLYNACDDSTQNAIVNTMPDFFTTDENALLTKLEALVTKKANPAVHRIKFGSITQNEQESLQDFVVRLRSSAVECEFSCPACSTDLSPTSHPSMKYQQCSMSSHTIPLVTLQHQLQSFLTVEQVSVLQVHSKHLPALGITQQLISCSKRISAVAGSILPCQGWIPVEFNIQGHITKQPLYICHKVDRIYFSKQACVDTKIIHLVISIPNVS